MLKNGMNTSRTLAYFFDERKITRKISGSVFTRTDFRANFIDHITKVLVKPSNCGGLIAAGQEISARLPAKFAEKTRVIQGENE